ncbi:MAG: phytanoyl-CoA dioxygenase family protein [Sphingobium sp.]
MPSSLPSLLRWPLWIAALGTGAKSFADNPLIGSRRLNAMGLHRARMRVSHAMTRWRRRLLAGGIGREDRDAFDRQGYVEWHGVLSPDAFARMRGAILEQAWPAREQVQGDAITRRIAVDDAMLRAVPDLRALLDSPRWCGLMHYVAGSRARPRYYIQTILTHRADNGTDPQNDIHSDAFHPSMKAWLFLTDVAPEDGPFAYVPGSHRLTDERLDWDHGRALDAPDGLDRLSARGSMRIDAEALPSLRLPQPQPFAVPANTLIVADTFGFHVRMPSDRPSVRVELWAYSRRNPFLLWPGLHAGSLPGIATRRMAMIWWLRDRLEKHVPHPWRAVGAKRPAEP